MSIDRFFPNKLGCSLFIILIVSMFNTSFIFVRIDESEDEDTSKEYVEETNKDAIMIAAAKLVASDTVSTVKLILNWK